MLIRTVNERLSLDGADKNQNKMDGILSNAQKGLRSDQKNNYLDDIENFIRGRKQVFTSKTLNGKIKVILMK